MADAAAGRGASAVPLADVLPGGFFDRLDDLLEQEPCTHDLAAARAVMSEMTLSEQDAEALSLHQNASMTCAWE